MGDPLLCGVDAGTSRVRAMLFTLAGTVVAQADRPTPTRYPRPGWAEHDAEELWAATVAALRDVTGQVDDPTRIRGIACASVGEAGVVVDREGRPVFPVIAWFDTRTTSQLDGLLEQVGFSRLHGITGLCPDPTFTLPKLLWQRANEPDAFARATSWLSVAEWLAFRLTGQRATDVSHASRTMLLDIHKGVWAKDLAAEVRLDAGLLGEIGSSGTRLGTLLAEAAAATGLPADCVVGVAGHDHICGMFTVGADRPGVLLDSMGSAEALTLILDAPSRDPELGRAGFNQGLIDAGRRLSYAFGGLPTSGAAVEWFRSTHEGVDHATLLAEAEQVEQGAHEVMFFPHLRIGSPPFPDPVGRGAFIGLSSSCSRGVLYRAVLEGVVLDVANILDHMLALCGAGRPDRIVAIGGSTRNPLIIRLKADLFEAPVEFADMPEATCLGAALLGGIAAGLFADLPAARSGLTWSARRQLPSGVDHRRRKADFAAMYAALRPLHAGLLRA
ncbi:MAG: FGGY family carbohydrate kinase [Geminicoccaceae bacterium]